VLQLIKFINDAADPRAIFTDLQEIAHGEGGLVYAAHTVPAIVRQFGPMTLRSPARRLSQECKRFEKDSERGSAGRDQARDDTTWRFSKARRSPV
jgi:hypothetical protein